jgi:hypothetical protein
MRPLDAAAPPHQSAAFHSPTVSPTREAAWLIAAGLHAISKEACDKISLIDIARSRARIIVPGYETK